MENVEYYTQRLQCSDEEKDACLETVAKLYRLRYLIRRDGILMAEALAEEEIAGCGLTLTNCTGKRP